MSTLKGTKESVAYQTIRNAIIKGELAAGQKISIRSLSEQYNFGRTPISDALKRLSTEGWVESMPGVSTRVAIVNRAERYEFLQVRGAMEALAVRLCTERKDLESVLNLSHILAVEELAIYTENWIRAAEADIEFHIQCAIESGNQFLTSYYQQLIARDQRTFYRNIPDPEARRLSHLQHEEILRCIEAGDPKMAEQASIQHTNTILEQIRQEEQRLSQP